MKKNRMVIFLAIVVLTFILFANYINASGLGNGFDNSIVGNEDVDISIKASGYRIIQIVMTFVQVFAVIGIAVAGIRYMFAGSNAKAEIKKGVISVFIGSAIIFGMTTFMKIILGTFENILK